MNQYSQVDPKWSKVTMGKTSTTIGRSGCFITSLGMLAGMTPPDVNTLLTKNGGYVGASVISDKAAKILGLPYNGKTGNPQKTVCIAETNNFAPSYPQHFFVWLGDGNIIDPLDGKKKRNPYHIVSYRLFSPKNNPTPPQGGNMKLSQLPDGEFNKEMDMTFVKGNGSYTGPKDRQDWIKAYGDLDVDGTQFRDKRWGHPNRKITIDKLEMSFKTGKMWTREDFYNPNVKATDPVNRPDSPQTVDKAAIASHADAIKKLVA